MVEVVPIRAFTDNYIWVITRKEQRVAAIVDPGESESVLAYLQENDLTPEAILLTHHHHDHIGGVKDITREYPDILVYGPSQERLGISHQHFYPVDEHLMVSLEKIDLSFKVFNLPGHTLGHIGYYNDDYLFAGDTLFSVGCGKLFEGTVEQMVDSLEKIKSLPDHIQAFPAHEYTAKNIDFARLVDPTNKVLTDYAVDVMAKLSENKPSLPTTIGLEKNVNPFLRCDKPSIKDAAEKRIENTVNNPVEVFAVIRAWKDGF